MDRDPLTGQWGLCTKGEGGENFFLLRRRKEGVKRWEVLGKGGTCSLVLKKKTRAKGKGNNDKKGRC